MEPPVVRGQKSSLRHMMVMGREKGRGKDVTQARAEAMGPESGFGACILKLSHGTRQLSGKQWTTPLDLLFLCLPSRNFSLACETRILKVCRCTKKWGLVGVTPSGMQPPATRKGHQKRGCMGWKRAAAAMEAGLLVKLVDKAWAPCSS